MPEEIEAPKATGPLVSSNNKAVKIPSPKKEDNKISLESESGDSKVRLVQLEALSTTGSDDQSIGNSGCDDSSQDSPVDNTQPQFYIEVDATAVANLKAGTQYTLVPVDQTRGLPEVEISGSHESPCSMEDTKDIQRWDATTDKSILPNESSYLNSGRSADMTIACPMVQDSPGPSASKAMEVAFSSAAGGGGDNMTLTDSAILNLSTIASSASHHPGACMNHGGDHNPKALSYSPLTTLPHMQHPQMLKVGYESIGRFDSPRMQHHMSGTPQSVSSGFPMLPTALHPTRLYGTPMLSPLSHPSSTHTRSMHHQQLNHNWSPYSQTFANPSYHAAMMNPNSSSSGTPSCNGSSVSLNGSGDEVEHNPSDYSRMGMSGVQQIVGPLDNVPYYMPFNGRENHNEKERKRRSRIKNACQTLRSLVPGLSEKTDKATVFEFTVQYVLHLKRNTGPKYDKDFMEKYSPY